MAEGPEGPLIFGTRTQNTWKKMKNDPFIPLGFAGFIGVAAYGLAGAKNRPANQSLSVYLMHLRVKAQAMIVGAMAFGICYSIARKIQWNTEEKEKKLGDQQTDRMYKLLKKN